MDLDIPVRKPDFSHITDEMSRLNFSIYVPKDRDLVVCLLYPDTLKIKEVWLHTEDSIGEPVQGASDKLTHTDHDFVFLHPKHFHTVLRWAQFGMEVVDTNPESHTRTTTAYPRNNDHQRFLWMDFEDKLGGVTLHDIKWLDGAEEAAKASIISELKTSFSDHFVTVWEHFWLESVVYDDVLSSPEDAYVKKLSETDKEKYLAQATLRKNKVKSKRIAAAEAYHRFNLDFEKITKTVKTPDSVLDAYEKITSRKSHAFLAPYEEGFWGLHKAATPGNVGKLADETLEQMYYDLQESRLGHSYSPFDNKTVSDHIANRYGIANLDATII